MTASAAWWVKCHAAAFRLAELSPGRSTGRGAPVDPITAAARCAFSSQHRYNVGTDRVVEGERQRHHLRLAVALFSSASAGIHEPPAVLDVGVMKVTKVNAT